ncbi:MAG TPA: mitochondrial fission ELM1 family protein [Stellaceae bacterium]
MANQTRGLAEALGWPIVEKRLAIRAPWRYLAPGLWLVPGLALDPTAARLEPPWPDIVIACGRNSIVPARLVKRASGGRSFWVQVQDPRFARAEIDLIVAPRHDPAPGENVFRTLGAVHRVTPQKLGTDAARWAPTFAALPRPLVAVLIGGDNSVYRLTEQGFGALCDRLVALAKSGIGLAITPSRRTDDAQRAVLHKRLAGLPAYVWDGNGDNPYFGMLGIADAILVTADSVSMISEAAATGKPVHIVELEGGSDKFARFHQGMRDAGITRIFNGTLEEWHYIPPDDTARAAAEIRRRFQKAT